jgi:signal transduction histidine kinase
MSENVLNNALLPFYSTKRSGTGLGLSLCREIAGHGGRISLAAVRQWPCGLSGSRRVG